MTCLFNVLAAAAFITADPPLAADLRPDAVRRDACDTLVAVRAFTNPKPVAKAVWRTTGLGVYETYVNGAPDRAHALKPGVSHTARRRLETTWDLGGVLRKGAGETNVFAARVTSGWWRDQTVRWWGVANTNAAFRGALELTYADGSRDVLETDGSWKAAWTGQVVHAAIYYGETVDARVDEVFLTDPKASQGWRNAVPCGEFRGEITPNGAEVCWREDLAMRPVRAYVWKGVTGAAGTNVLGRVRIVRTFAAGEPMELAPGETLVVDFGQNCAAVPELAFSSARGAELTVNFGEALNDGNGDRARGNDGPEGSVYLANMRSCRSQLDYIFAGDGTERCRPSLSFWGYRYLTARATHPVRIVSLRSVPVSSVRSGMERGTLTTGDASVNRLVANARWGMLSNYLSIPMDCPQRDERQGWAGDTQVFAMTALYCADVSAFLGKWMDDVADSQLRDGTVCSVAPLTEPAGGENPKIGWSDAAVIVPWTVWRMSGDVSAIRRSWPVMRRFVDRIAKDRYATPRGEMQFGDWLCYEKWESCKECTWAGGPGWDGDRTEYRFWWGYLGGCYLLWDARRMAEMAAAIGEESARAEYARLAEETLAYLRQTYLTAEGDLIPAFRDLQSAHLFALRMGLVPTAAARDVLRKRLRGLIHANGDRHATGFLGTSILLDTLAEEADSPDLAYTILLQHGCPGWLYSVDQGATTIWERWNGYTLDRGFGPVSMNSFNHYAYGSILAWLYGTAAGIRPGPRGGFDEFELAPRPDARLGSIDASFRTARGVIRSAWKYEGGVCTWTFTVPAGSVATVKVNGEVRRYEAGTHNMTMEDRSCGN